jgi:serine/threonine-protein kinase
MKLSWGWIWGYLGSIVAAAALGLVLPELPLFRHRLLPELDVRGAEFVRLFWFGAAAVLFLKMIRRLGENLGDDARWRTFLKGIIAPSLFLVSLVVGNALSSPELIAPIRPWYSLVYAALLVWGAMWLTIRWVGRIGVLQRTFESWRKPAEEPAPEDEAPSVEKTVILRPSIKDTRERPSTSTASPTPATLGRYKVLKELGRGAMSVVYLGKDPKIHRFVAIKTLRLDSGDDSKDLQEFKTRFYREAESTGRLCHPNIVTIYDAGEEEGVAFIAMEYLEGTTLKERCRKEALLPPSEAIDIVATAAEALDHAHAQGIVHRDIKPANIMVTKARQVKVMDFGIAKMPNTTKTTTGVMLGTPSYMSPEQVLGKPVDGRTDLYSLGLVFFELLTGQKPFHAENLTALMYKIVHEPPPAVTSLRSDLAPDLQPIFDRVLHKDPVHRYHRAKEFAQALRATARRLAA